MRWANYMFKLQWWSDVGNRIEALKDLYPTVGILLAGLVLRMTMAINVSEHLQVPVGRGNNVQDLYQVCEHKTVSALFEVSVKCANDMLELELSWKLLNLFQQTFNILYFDF